MLKESYNLIGQETHVTTRSQKWQSQMLLFLDDSLHAKEITYQFTLSGGIDDQKNFEI